MEIDPIKQFAGQGEILSEHGSRPVHVTGQYREHDAAPVQLEIIYEIIMQEPNEAAPDAAQPPAAREEIKPVLRGTTASGRQFAAPDFDTSHWNSSTSLVYSRASRRGATDFFMLGDLDEEDTPPGTLYCTISVPPTPIAKVDHHLVARGDGTVIHYEALGNPNFAPEERRGIRWTTSLGQAELMDEYTYARGDEVQVGLDHAEVRLRRYRIQIEARHAGPLSLETVLARLPDELDDALWLISLLSHKRIAWYKAEAVYIPDEHPEGVYYKPPDATGWRRTFLGISEQHEWHHMLHDWPMIERAALRGDFFQELLGRYRESDLKGVIREVIILLLVSYEVGYVEHHLVSLFTALEVLVDRLSKKHKLHFALGSSRFEKFKDRLEEFIVQQVEDEVVAASIIAKLPELRRRPFRERLDYLLKAYAVDLSRIWPEGSEVEEDLGGILGRRHKLIHKGDYPSGFYHADRTRLQSLIELWLLRLLDCPYEVMTFARVESRTVMQAGKRSS